jgi:CDP-diglyceride synthetase
MRLKKLKIISVITIFLLSFFVHYGYELFPSFLTSIFFPINESLFEHMKLISTCYLIWSIFEYKILENKTNFKSNLIISIIINIGIFLLMFYPIYLKFDHNLIITLLIYLLSIILTQILSYFILKSNKELKINRFLYPFISLIILINIIFTYFPLNNNFFIDYMNKKIGFSNYY